ncbi:MAG: HEAT repeat domain-containing protein [Planctomycetota bacterium]
MFSRPWLSLLLFLSACASAEPDAPKGEFDPKIEEKAVARQEAVEAGKEFDKVLLQLDQALDIYVRAVSNAGIARYDTERDQLDRLLRQLVSGQPEGSNTHKLVALASDGSEPYFQGIALAALGFADRSDAMSVILQGAQLTDENLVDRAILGLAILRDPRTPPGVIARVVEDQKHNERGRIGAAWALVHLQENSLRSDEIVPVWLRVLEGDKDQHPLLLANALRGLGLTRDAKYAEDAAKFIGHPTPRVRMNAAVAIGRMNAQGQFEALLTLLGPGETVPNVRLAARKALQQLAGNVDRGYDVALWRREFERGS